MRCDDDVGIEIEHAIVLLQQFADIEFLGPRFAGRVSRVVERDRVVQFLCDYKIGTNPVGVLLKTHYRCPVHGVVTNGEREYGFLHE